MKNIFNSCTCYRFTSFLNNIILLGLFRYQVVLELQEDGKLITSDDPPIVFGSLNSEFVQKVLFGHEAYINNYDA
jgi:hypothetical protein